MSATRWPVDGLAGFDPHSEFALAVALPGIRLDVNDLSQLGWARLHLGAEGLILSSQGL